MWDQMQSCDTMGHTAIDIDQGTFTDSDLILVNRGNAATNHWGWACKITSEVVDTFLETISSVPQGSIP